MIYDEIEHLMMRMDVVLRAQGHVREALIELRQWSGIAMLPEIKDLRDKLELAMYGLTRTWHDYHDEKQELVSELSAACEVVTE